MHQVISEGNGLGLELETAGRVSEGTLKLLFPTIRLREGSHG